MNIAVIGLGSMGKRRIRLIRKSDASIRIIGIDTNFERRTACKQEYVIDTCDDFTKVLAMEKINGVFVCTPPITHNLLIRKSLEAGLHVFTELNLVADGYDENTALAKAKNLVLFLSSTFLYREEIKYVQKQVEQINCLLNYTYHVGQYLPDWHPWEQYSDFFVSNQRSNGCREIFAIELPWLSKVFGKIKKVTVLKDQISSLHIDYKDNYLVLVEHVSGHKGMLAVDIVSRKAVRNLEVFGEKMYLHWDGSPQGLFQYDFEEKLDKNIQLYQNIDRLDNYSSFVIENAYLSEIELFFKAIVKEQAMVYSFDEDRDILRIIDRIEA